MNFKISLKTLFASLLCTSALLANNAYAIPDYTIDIVELSTTEVCTACTPHGLGEVNGEIITYATQDSDSDNLLAYGADGSFIEIAPGLSFTRLNDADGSYIAASGFGLDNVSGTGIDYNNPGVFINPEDISTGVSLDVFSVNLNGSFAGGLDGLVAGAFTETAASSTFLPGPESALGIAFDISSDNSIVVGQSRDSDDILNIATIWEVDQNLQIVSSFFIGTGEGEAEFVGNTLFDSEATVLFNDNGASRFYLKSTEETGSFGANFRLITALDSAFITRDISQSQINGECFASVPNSSGSEMASLGAACVDATQIGNTGMLLSPGFFTWSCA